MPFNIALSGIRAASTELEITGNNIANASTTGFKGSRAEFGDVYATSVLGGGGGQAGAGVQVQDVTQRFTQGNVTFTENELDMAINGNGFFVVSQGGDTLFTRAGSFGLDDQGNVVTNTNARLQGFTADSSGDIGGIRGDIGLQTSNLSPRQTTGVESVLNLDSTNPVLQSTGRQFVTEGNVIGVAQVGQQSSTSSILSGGIFTLPLANDFSASPINFDLQLFGSTGNQGTVSIILNDINGVPDTVSTLNDLRTLTSVINAQIFSPTAPQTPIDVVAQAVETTPGNFEIRMESLLEGDPSTIVISNQVGSAADIGINAAATSFIQGIPEVSNGYPLQTIDITTPSGETLPFTMVAGATAAEIASSLNSVQGITATGSTRALLSGFVVSGGGNMSVRINGNDFTAGDLAELETQINSSGAASVAGITAVLDTTTGELQVASAGGDDIRVEISGLDGDTLSVQGDSGTLVESLTVDNLNVNPGAAVVGGAVDITIAQGYAIGNENPLSIGLFQPLGDTLDPLNPVYNDVVLNAFDSTDQDTYNSATSMTVYDSLGNQHVMTQYFVKQDFDPNDANSAANHWQMFVQVDGENVGDPVAADPTAPTQASYDVFFNEDGSFNELLTSDILISNWNPIDVNGAPNGAQGPLNVLNGGSAIITDPSISSNFIVELTGTTQFGSEFSVNDVDQNGFTTGQLSGLNIDDSGVIFARYTNGESLVLGQVVLADFTNQQGLQPIGNSMWAESFESGTPNVGVPGSASLGAIQAGALEESNVDLSEQLVALIIAQRNFQASAKTIETADQTTQTIINLR
ncbi:MAG: flagellar hook protein FlgE [Flavobacteriales bacterium]|jgi:flagellar hook protein FlgE